MGIGRGAHRGYTGVVVHARSRPWRREVEEDDGGRTEDEEAAIVLGLVQVLLDVEEEDVVVTLLLRLSSWRGDGHGVGAAQLSGGGGLGCSR